jgi:hypothetical protein
MPVSKHLSILPLTSVKESLFFTYKYALRQYSHVIKNLVTSSFNVKSVVSFKIIRFLFNDIITLINLLYSWDINNK